MNFPLEICGVISFLLGTYSIETTRLIVIVIRQILSPKSCGFYFILVLLKIALAELIKAGWPVPYSAHCGVRKECLCAFSLPPSHCPKHRLENWPANCENRLQDQLADLAVSVLCVTMCLWTPSPK